MFPLKYRGEIEIPHFNKSEIADYQKQLVTKAAEKLKSAKASNIELQGNRVNFKVNFFRLVSNWNILTHIDNGYIEVFSSSEKLAVSYLISFKRLFILGTIIVIGAGIFIFQEGILSGLEIALLMTFFWFLMIGLNWLIALIRFPAFVGRIIQETSK